MPGAFKLDHLQPFEPILFQKISNFFIFILGGQFLLPQSQRRLEKWSGDRDSQGASLFLHFSINDAGPGLRELAFRG